MHQKSGETGKLEDSKMSVINGKGSINKDAYTYVYAT